VIRVGLARTRPSYAGLEPPWSPGAEYPELTKAFGAAANGGPFNSVYAAVRGALHALGLDAERFGTAEWNPLGALVAPGRRIVLKPNFIRHWNPCAEGTVDSVITHGAVVRAMADYAFLAAGDGGSVVIAEAPQQDCDFDRIREITGLDAIVAFYRQSGRVLEVVDLRREWVVFRDGIITERHRLPGDPAGYRAVDLGERSFFTASGLDPRRFRGADYDPAVTAQHHQGGRHAYLLSETVLSADLVVNLPKLKTHKKTGVTLSLKNLVGINGDKNWLPHHSVGSPSQGGDEFPGRSWIDRARSSATELARPLLRRGIGLGLFRAARRLENAARGADFVRSGNWYGNQTTWRMCCDLNRCLYYSDAQGLHLDAPAPVRTVLNVIDGVVAGDGEGPLSPRDVPLGVILAGTDPVATDLVAVRLMGFDESRLPIVREAMKCDQMRLTAATRPDDVEVFEHMAETGACIPVPLCALQPTTALQAHSGWQGRVERPDPAG
jgi:uncharacterized protein (DUF362 family)